MVIWGWDVAHVGSVDGTVSFRLLGGGFLSKSSNPTVRTGNSCRGKGLRGELGVIAFSTLLPIILI
jgi:hypothetical protein